MTVALGASMADGDLGRSCRGGKNPASEQGLALTWTNNKRRSRRKGWVFMKATIGGKGMEFVRVGQGRGKPPAAGARKETLV